MLHYHGIHETCELEQTSFVSGTQIRAAAALAANNSVDFRRGIVYGSYNQYDKVESTGDIVVYDVEKKRVLVGRKPAEDGYRLPGGFIQPGETHDAGARRELREEAGSFEVDTLEYVGSYVIDDWRYRNEANKITTILYLAPYLFGPIEAGDDLSEVKWVTLQQLQGMLDGSGSPALGTIEDTHQALLIAAVDYINKTQRGL